MSPFGRPFADGDRLEIAGAVVRLKIHPRARRVSLRLDRTRREVVATAPSARRLAEAVEFARSRIDWICARLGELPAPRPLAPGRQLRLFDEPHVLARGEGRARRIAPEGGAPGRLLAPGEDEAFARGAVRLLKREALAGLTRLTAAHAATLGEPAPEVRVMDARSRWGSCKPGLGRSPSIIRYSWRLALAPLSVADYVAAHECAHLRELNHSPRFWAVVHDLVGDPAPHRAWLREHGARLHAFGAA